MNIVKIKDVLMPNEFEMSEFFNDKLKGKYAFWIQMRYIFPLDSLNYKTYIRYEQLSDDLMKESDVLQHIDMYNEECSMSDFVNKYIDIEETERVNEIHELLLANQYVIDADLDINKLRVFRTWLASELLLLNTGNDGQNLGHFSTNLIHVLEYYKNGMYDEVVKQLSIFGKNEKIDWNITTSCGCCTNNEVLTLNDSSYCDALLIYRKNIHNLMVSEFKNIEFWMQFNKKFILLFKHYIDNIIRVGFVIKNDESSVISNCSCNVTETYSNEKFLRNLSTSLQYIYDDNITGNKNFIQDSLYNWAEYLYDHMYWVVK